MKITKLSFILVAPMLLSGCSLFAGGGGDNSSSTFSYVISEGDPYSESSSALPELDLPGNDFMVYEDQSDYNTIYHFDTTNKKLSVKFYNTFAEYVNGEPSSEDTVDYRMEKFEKIATYDVYKQTAFYSLVGSNMVVFFYADDNGEQGKFYRMVTSADTANYDEVKRLACEVYQVSDTKLEALKQLKGKVFRCEERTYRSNNRAAFEVRFGPQDVWQDHNGSHAIEKDFAIVVSYKPQGATDFRFFVPSNYSVEPFPLLTFGYNGIQTSNKTYNYRISSYDPEEKTITLFKEKAKDPGTWDSLLTEFTGITLYEVEAE